MFIGTHKRWLAGAFVASALTISPLLSGIASAQTLTGSASTVTAGAMLTIQGKSYQADEPIGFWINVPSGTAISASSLGQTDTNVEGNVIPLDAMTSADDFGSFTYTLNTAGLPAGNYSLVAHGLNSRIDELVNFTVTAASTAPAPAPAQGTTLASGALLPITGTTYSADEPIGFWINIPSGTSVAANSLGQTDTTIDGTVVPIDAVTYADDNGAFSFALNTAGLPNGNYSVVAHGMNSRMEQVYMFTISGSATASGPSSLSPTPVSAGTMLTLKATSYQANEPVGLWINIPNGITVSSSALGQTDTVIDGTVIPLDALGYADGFGNLTYTLNTSGLPAGNYSIVAHGLNSHMEQVFTFTIQ